MTAIAPHLSTQVGLFQPATTGLPVGVAVLILVALLLLAFGLGALLARRPRPAPAQPSPWLADVLNALPFPAALVSPEGSPLAVNAEAASWLEARSPQHLVSPLNTLVQHVVASHRTESVQVMLGEGQSPSGCKPAHSRARVSPQALCAACC